MPTPAPQGAARCFAQQKGYRGAPAAPSPCTPATHVQPTGSQPCRSRQHRRRAHSQPEVIARAPKQPRPFDNLSHCRQMPIAPTSPWDLPPHQLSPLCGCAFWVAAAISPALGEPALQQLQHQICWDPWTLHSTEFGGSWRSRDSLTDPWGTTCSAPFPAPDTKAGQAPLCC